MTDPAPALDGLVEPSGGGSPPRRVVIRWVLVLAVTGVSLYVVLPGLLATFGYLPRLREVRWGWFVLIAALECSAFYCLWQLQRAALGVAGVFKVACSQLAGNAVSRSLPGGAAAGGVLQQRMLIRAGLDPTHVATALTAAGLMAMTTLFGLPVLALPALFAGESVAPPLVKGALVGAGLFVALVVLGTVFLAVDRVVLAVVRFAGRVLRHLPGRRDLDPELLALSLLNARTVVRKALAGSWRRAVPSALGNQLFDVAALQISLVAIGGHLRPSITLLCYVAAGALAVPPGGLRLPSSS